MVVKVNPLQSFLRVWLTSTWLLLLAWRWVEVRSEKGYDPSGLWLEHFQVWPGGWWILPLLALGAGVVGAFRLGWPKISSASIPLERAWLAYVAMSVASLLWMIPSAALSPLGQQYFYSFWLGLCLWPVRKQLGPLIRPGWWKWGLCTLVLALLGALVYARLFHPAPSANQAVPLLLASSGVTRGAWLFLLVGLTPVLEECWYRGLLSGPTRLRMLFSALIFGLIHCDPSALPQLVWLGLVFGWARWGGGLAAAVLAHALWNLTVAVYYLGA